MVSGFKQLNTCKLIKQNMIFAASNQFISTLPSLFAILVSTLVAFTIYWLAIGRYRFLNSIDISGPKPLPFVGHLFDLAKHKYNYHLLLDTYYKKYGRVFKMYFQAKPTIVVSDPDMIKQILVKDFSKFHDRQVSLFQ